MVALRRFLPALLVLAVVWPCAAQTANPSLPLVIELAPDAFDSEALRASIERELAVPVERVPQASGAHLAVVADSPSAVRLSFVRADGSRVERTVDVTSTGIHANDTLALVAANLMRDEAADLLAGLQAKEAVAPPPPAAPAPPPPPPEPELPKGCDARPELKSRKIGLDLLPYVGMSTEDGTSVERTISLSLFGGLTGSVRGVELSGFLNLDEYAVCGAQFSGAANLVGGPVQGFQASMVNWSGGRLDGAQFAMVNGALGPVRGAQYGTVNFAGGDVRGAQFGLVGVSAGHVRGAQLGLANVAAFSLTGAQLGLLNVAGASVHGAQLGVVNVSSAETRGAQLGLTNISAGPVRGTMIGLVNTAEDADAAIGLVNVLWRGRTHLDVWATDFGMFMVGVEHGSRIVHNVTGIGIGRRDNRAVFAPAYGLGARVMQFPRLWLDIDALAYWLFVRDEDNEEFDMAVVSQLRIPLSVRLTDEIALFAGPALNVSVARDDDLIHDPSLLGSERLTDDEARTIVRIWPGFVAGARFF